VRTRIYVAGPYTSSPVSNTLTAIDVGQELLDAGYAPMVPHLTHYWHMRIENPWQSWMELDLPWVSVAHAVYRIPGESTGADQEVALAESLGIPVYYSIADLMREVETEQPLHKVPQPQPASAPPAVERALETMRAIFAKKNADYAAGDWKSNFMDVAVQMGWDSPAEAAEVLIAVKQARLKSLRVNGREPANESVTDTVLDRAVYALIRLAMELEASS
jgi:hypothetical protein